jgi:glycerol-3-phosphate cytidylyltransferase-like family protein
MKSTAVVFEHHFDPELLEQIESLRTVRLNLAEKMLSDLPKTITDLKAQGLAHGNVPEIDERELRRELEDKVSMLRSRIENPEVVYADEISFYVDLIDNDVNFENVEIY